MKQKELHYGWVFCLIALLFSCKEESAPEPVPEEPKPTADFVLTQVSEDDPFTYAFENKSTNFEQVRWEYGDDSTSLEVSPTHTFLETGTFRVLMRAENGQGYWAQKESVIHISPDSLLEINAAPAAAGTLDLSLLTGIAVESLTWYKGTGTNLELISEEPSTNISVATGQFQDYTLEVKTPNGSVARISRLLTDLGIVTDITSEGNLSVSRDNNSGAQSGEGSLKLVDNNYGSKFLQFDYVGDLWFQLEYFEPVVIGAYTFTSGNDAPGRDPKNWHLSGSNDGENWTVLDTRENEVFEGPNEGRGLTRTFVFQNNTAYNFYRVYVTSVGSGTLFQMGEWRVLELPQ